MKLIQKIKRRKFIKTSLQAGGAVCFGMIPGCQREGNGFTTGKEKSTIVDCCNDRVRDKNGKLIGDEVGKLLNNAVENLFEVDQSVNAWKQLFKKDDIVGIKVNCLAGRGMSTHIELIDSIVECLKQADIPDRHIIIWDRSNRDLKKAGYKIRTGKDKLKCYGTDLVGYTRELYEFGEVGSSLSNILVKQCTAIINVPILKDHGIVGITNAMKNFFGAIHNPNKYHDFCGDPYVPDVYMLEEIKSKTRLTICDTLAAQYEGGPPYMPQWEWKRNGIFAGFDPVALDAYGWKIIETKRKENGLPTLKEAGREPTYIATAADINHQLGVNNLDKVKLIRV